jgi:AcrR family transcriptional regulator
MRVNAQIKAETRRALLDAAAQAFAESGFHRANVDRVSQDAGLAKGTIYNYFPSKQAIFEAVLTEACALAAESADAVPDSATTQARLEAFVAGNLAWARKRTELAMLLAREITGGEAETRKLILDASAPCVEKVAAILQAGHTRDELAFSAPAPALAVMFIVLTNALLLQASQDDLGWPSVEMLPAVASGLFLRGVGGVGTS